MKYLFTAVFENGLYITQTPNDTSKVDEKKSAFFDVLQEIEKGNKLFLFCLTYNDDNGFPHDYIVDLRDGHFQVDGNVFWLHQAGNDFSDFRLIYFRKVNKIYNEGYEEIRTEISFNFGWQSLKNGENVQKIITLV